MKILLAEDDAIVRRAVAAGLVADGYEVELAEDGEEAFSIAHAVHPDMIISDVLMPNMDGFSLCQAVRSDKALQAIPVVFYSATFLEPEDEALSRLVGASGFVLKDVDQQTFLRKLRDVVKSEKANEPPKFDANPEHLDFEDRLHHKALITKLLNKVQELKIEKKALRESKKFLKHVVTTIPDVIFVLRLPEQEVRYVAPQAERLLGYSSEELIGGRDRWQPIVDDFDFARVEQEIERAVAEARDITFTWRMRHKQGGIRWIEGRVSPRLNDVGEAIELFGVLTDVTDRFEQEEQIRQNESRLNTLFSNLPGMAYRRENRRAWNMEFVSEGVELLTGYRRDELENSRIVSYADLIHPQDQALVWDEIQEALDKGRQFSFVYRILHKDGTTRWVWERGVGVEDDERYIEGFISDITLRKHDEENLAESEQLFRSVFENMEHAISVQELVYTSDGKATDYRFLTVNSAFEQIMGLDAEQVVGHTVREVFPEMSEAWITDYIHVAENGRSANFVRELPSQGKRYKVFAYQTQQDRFATVFFDITEPHAATKQASS